MIVRRWLQTLAAARRRVERAWLFAAPGEYTRCPACRSAHLFELDVLRAYRGRVRFISGCETCGLVFCNPPPPQEEVAAFYTPEGAWGAPRSAAHDEEPGRRPTRGRPRWTRQFAAIEAELPVLTPPPGARVLDFGCGSGAMLDTLQDCGWDTWGIETATDRAFARHHRLHDIPGEPQFDLVIAHHVLEHTLDPLDVLCRLAASCRPGGYLLVGTPRFDTLPVHRDFKYVINGRTHLTAYTWPCLQGLLGRAGWQAVAAPEPVVYRREVSHARMRVLARRVSGPVALPDDPARAARRAMRGYYAARDERPRLARWGWLRLAARQLTAERRRAKSDARKSGSRAADPGAGRDRRV